MKTLVAALSLILASTTLFAQEPDVAIVNTINGVSVKISRTELINALKNLGQGIQFSNAISNSDSSISYTAPRFNVEGELYPISSRSGHGACVLLGHSREISQKYMTSSKAVNLTEVGKFRFFDIWYGGDSSPNEITVLTCGD